MTKDRKWCEHATKFSATANDWLRLVAERRETATKHKPERVSQQKRVLEVLSTVFPPDGRPPTGLTLKEIQNLIEPEFTKRCWRLASTDTIARALGRRG
jgi:transposase